MVQPNMRSNLRHVEEYLLIEQVYVHLIIVHHLLAHQIHQRFLNSAHMKIALENRNPLFRRSF